MGHGVREGQVGGLEKEKCYNGKSASLAPSLDHHLDAKSSRCWPDSCLQPSERRVSKHAKFALIRQ